MVTMMTRDEAKRWSRQMTENGTYPLRTAYRKKFRVGGVVETLGLWDDNNFTYGMEYGLLIAVAVIFGDLTQEEIDAERLSE